MNELEMIAVIALLWGAASVFLYVNPLSDFSALCGYLSLLSPWTLVGGYYFTTDKYNTLTWMSPAAGTLMGIIALGIYYIGSRRQTAG